MKAGRFAQSLFVASLVGTSWMWMMIIHEAGHVVGAYASGGTVARVVVHPLGISRTDLALNPHPGFVAWMGPVSGCLLPLAALAALSGTTATGTGIAQFFAGFCLVANGAYIGIGSFTAAGDCGDMLRAGSPMIALWIFGGLAVAGGLALWHRLGSLRSFLRDERRVRPKTAWASLVVFAATVAGAWALGG